MRSGQRRLLTAAAASAVLLSCAVVWAQAADGDMVLHEYFNPWDVDVTSSAGQASAGAAAPPDAQTKVTPGEPPGLSVNPGADEVIFGADGPVDPGSTSAPYGPLDPEKQASKLDDATDRVDQLDYYANFEPSVVPYKRGVVQNAVRYADGDYMLTLQTDGFRRVGVAGGEPRADEDVFWGSFLFRAQRGQRHPLPSVAPDQRILEVQSEPDVSLRIVRDDADNFYVIPPRDGLLRLNMRIAAPRSYFGGGLPAEVGWSDFAKRTPELPAAVARAARGVLSNLSVSRQMRPIDALDALVEHYRNFEGRPFPAELRGEDLYASISRAQIGVCRHRSLAFVISARALGIPTRYVYNEAHAFVEVYWPKVGWRRIDLGGAADELDYSGRSGGSVHNAGPDALPQPPNYKAELERIRERGGLDEAGQEGAQGADGRQGAGQQGAEQAAGQTQPGESPQDQLQDAQQGEATPPPGGHGHEMANAGAQGDQSQTDDPRARVSIDVKVDASELFRGNSLGLQGSVFTAQGHPVVKKPVEVFLGPVGAHSSEALISLGTLRTDTGGRFSGELPIPDSISIGRWSVVLKFAGDDKFQPASVE